MNARGIPWLLLAAATCAMPGALWAQTQADASGPQKPRVEFRLVSSLSGTVPDSEIPPGYERLPMDGRPDGPTDKTATATTSLIVKKTPEADARIIEKARIIRAGIIQITPPKPPLRIYASAGDPPIYSIVLWLTPDGQKRFAEITRRIVAENQKSDMPGRLAIVFNGKILSSPTVPFPIEGGRLEITGKFSRPEAEALLEILTTGKPDAPARDPE